MKYIFDVDHTLFDTDKFSEDAEPYKEDGTWVTPKIWDILDARYYLYDDAIETLEKLGKENVELLTAVTPELGPESEAFQKLKLEKSGLMELASSTTFMVGLKGEYVNEITQGEVAAFLDDRKEQLESVREFAPNVLPVLMERNKKNFFSGFEKIITKEELKSVSNLAEFIEAVRSWENELKNQ